MVPERLGGVRSLTRYVMVSRYPPLVCPEKKTEVTWSPPDSQRALPERHGRQAGTWSLLCRPVSLITSEPSDAITWMFHPPSRSE
jgi:hypothetical protein